MIKKYKFNYDFREATAVFEVDTEKFTVEMANATLEFFTWDYDKEENPIDEVLKKYAMEAIFLATANPWNSTLGIISLFENKEGYSKLDGSNGIKLIDVEGYEFSEHLLEVEII